MGVRIVIVFVAVIMFAVTTTVHANDDTNNYDAAGLKVLVRVIDDCINSDGFSPCIKKKALTFINRLSRMDKLHLTEEIVLVKTTDKDDTNFTDTDNSLPRGADSQEDTLDSMLMDRVTSYLKTRTLQVTMPKLTELVEEGPL